MTAAGALGCQHHCSGLMRTPNYAFGSARLAKHKRTQHQRPAARDCSCSVHASRTAKTAEPNRQSSGTRSKKAAQHPRKHTQQAEDQDAAAAKQQLAKKAAKQVRKLDLTQRAALLQGQRTLPDRFTVAAARILVSRTVLSLHFCSCNGC